SGSSVTPCNAILSVRADRPPRRDEGRRRRPRPTRRAGPTGGGRGRLGPARRLRRPSRLRRRDRLRRGARRRRRRRGQPLAAAAAELGHARSLGSRPLRRSRLPPAGTRAGPAGGVCRGGSPQALPPAHPRLRGPARRGSPPLRGPRLRPRRPPLRPHALVQRVPLLSGTRLHIATVPDDAVVLRPPPPSEEPIADVAAAVRDAFRFPLAGDSLEAVAPRGGRATILAELPSPPRPGAHQD